MKRLFPVLFFVLFTSTSYGQTCLYMKGDVAQNVINVRHINYATLNPVNKRMLTIFFNAHKLSIEFASEDAASRELYKLAALMKNCN